MCKAGSIFKRNQPNPLHEPGVFHSANILKSAQKQKQTPHSPNNELKQSEQKNKVVLDL